MEMGINKKSYGNRKTILISQDSFHVALPVKLSGDANAVIKAGEPLAGDLTQRLTTEFTASTSSSKGVLLHEVKLDSKGKGNGTIVIAGCIDKLKVDSSVATNIATAAIDNIILVEGSAI